MVRHMIQYFYTGDYTNCGKTTQSHNAESPEDRDKDLNPLRTHAKMFALADMYQIEGLMNLAATRYGEALDKHISVEEIFDSIPDVYGLTPETVRALRDRVVLALRTKLGHGFRWHKSAVCGKFADSLLAG